MNGNQKKIWFVWYAENRCDFKNFKNLNEKQKNHLLKFISPSFLTLLEKHACCKKFPALDNQHRKKRLSRQIYASTHSSNAFMLIFSWEAL